MLQRFTSLSYPRPPRYRKKSSPALATLRIALPTLWREGCFTERLSANSDEGVPARHGIQ